MKTLNCEDFEQFDTDIYVKDEFKVKIKSDKRKWREIENIKENRRLKKELARYDSYSF